MSRHPRTGLVRKPSDLLAHCRQHLGRTPSSGEADSQVNTAVFDREMPRLTSNISVGTDF